MLLIPEISFYPLLPHRTIYGFHAALDHNDAHISRLFVDWVTDI